ncbi:MAG: hypothetical protein ED559_03630 [Phycisphaera sp.]|nr:MAG: hypothetical protein ED559_03630 [Phycisphaera sp.]
MSHAQEHEYNPADPHGFHEDGHHGHVIVPWQVLLGVLLALLFFTVLTVFQAQFEKHAVYQWGWVIPGWVNIVLAMGIACIKGGLVALFFMQLRYDSGINVLLFLFTLFAVWLFIMFTALDLNNRGHITEWRSGEVISGGSGVGFGEHGASKGRVDINSAAGPVYMRVKDNYIAEHGIEDYEAHGHHDDHGGSALSDAWQSRSHSGLTPGLFSTGVWEHLDDGHGHSHDDHGHDDHGDDHAEDGEHHDEEHANDDHGEEEH